MLKREVRTDQVWGRAEEGLSCRLQAGMERMLGGFGGTGSQDLRF